MACQAPCKCQVVLAVPVALELLEPEAQAALAEQERQVECQVCQAWEEWEVWVEWVE